MTRKGTAPSNVAGTSTQEQRAQATEPDVEDPYCGDTADGLAAEWEANRTVAGASQEDP